MKTSDRINESLKSVSELSQINESSSQIESILKKNGFRPSGPNTWIRSGDVQPVGLRLDMEDAGYPGITDGYDYSSTANGIMVKATKSHIQLDIWENDLNGVKDLSKIAPICSKNS